MQRQVHQRHVGHTQPVQQHGDRIHEHGGLVGDDLQRRAEPVGVIGAVDLDEGLAGPASVREPLRAAISVGGTAGVEVSAASAALGSAPRADHGGLPHRRKRGRMCRANRHGSALLLQRACRR